MIQFTLDSVKKLGDYDSKFGQRYWCTTPDGDLPLMFNSMDADFDSKLENGPLQIVAEEKSERESGKGNPYLMLKKVKLVESTQPTQTLITKEDVDEVWNPEKPLEALPATQNSQLDRIEQKLEEILTYLLPENQ